MISRTLRAISTCSLFVAFGSRFLSFVSFSALASPANFFLAFADAHRKAEGSEFRVKVRQRTMNPFGLERSFVTGMAKHRQRDVSSGNSLLALRVRHQAAAGVLDDRLVKALLLL